MEMSEKLQSLSSSSVEEEDQLHRSINRANDPSSSNQNPTDITMEDSPSIISPSLIHHLHSYKDTLLDKNSPTTDLNAPPVQEAIYESDEDIECDMPYIKLSKNDKKRMAAPWSQALIVKAFGKSVGYKFLFPRVRSQWKPTGKFECIDIGDDFFIFRFGNQEDFTRVLTGGPWFAGPHFLTIRRWEPMFSPATATTTTTAIWAQLHQLPTDCFEMPMLQHIGHVLGKPLKIDSHMSTNIRGKYARICIQVDLNKPLVSQFRISNHIQKVKYEGITALCFDCGSIGHKASNCMANNPIGETEDSQESTNQVDPVPAAPAVDESGFGEWMVVPPRKPYRKPRNRSAGKLGNSEKDDGNQRQGSVGSGSQDGAQKNQNRPAFNKAGQTKKSQRGQNSTSGAVNAVHSPPTTTLAKGNGKINASNISGQMLSVSPTPNGNCITPGALDGPSAAICKTGPPPQAHPPSPVPLTLRKIGPPSQAYPPNQEPLALLPTPFSAPLSNSFGPLANQAGLLGSQPAAPAQISSPQAGCHDRARLRRNRNKSKPYDNPIKHRGNDSQAGISPPLGNTLSVVGGLSEASSSLVDDGLCKGMEIANFDAQGPQPVQSSAPATRTSFDSSSSHDSGGAENQDFLRLRKALLAFHAKDLNTIATGA